LASFRNDAVIVMWTGLASKCVHERVH
jgi:hypothetical protein